MNAFYEPAGGGFRATELTRGPWDPGAQHAGPPAALVGRAFERLPEAEDFQVCRLTFEILRPIPIATVEVEARIVRPGNALASFPYGAGIGPAPESSKASTRSGNPSGDQTGVVTGKT